MNMEMKKGKDEGDGESGRVSNTAHIPHPHNMTFYYSANSLGFGRDSKRIYLCLLLFLTLSMNIDNSLGSCYPPRIKHGKVQVKDKPYNGQYSNNSHAIISCDAGYHLKSGEVISCQNDKWISSDRSRVREDEICEKSNEERCDSPPEINHGYYRPPNSYYVGSGSGETDHAVGTELQAACEPSFALNCHQHSCGRIVCSKEGKWVPKDEPLINCAAVPQTVVSSGNSRDVRSDDVHGLRNTSSTQNYLILALALVCIVGVAALTIALLRRPLFCKKRDQSDHSDPHGHMVTSSSPHHNGDREDLDSIPVAMNTGIFIPGADYNLQDYHLQDGPLCGTQVFK